MNGFAALFLGAVSMEFGTRFLAEPRVPLRLDGPGEKLSMEFTVMDDFTVAAISVHCAEAENPPAYRVQLKTRAEGSPLTEASVVPRAGAWTTLPVRPYPVEAGKTYAIVIEADLMRSGGHTVEKVHAKRWAAFTATGFPNKAEPLDGAADPRSGLRYHDGAAWRFLGLQPVYALHGSGGFLEGNPYDQADEKPVHGGGSPGKPGDDLVQAQMLDFRCGEKLSGFAARLRKVGNPADPLRYQVLLSDYVSGKASLVLEGEIPESRSLGEDWQWVTVGFPGGLDAEPTCYFFALRTVSGSSGKGGENCLDGYAVSSALCSGGLAWGGDITYDGSAHRAARAAHSPDGGRTWNQDFETDLHVVAFGPPCPRSSQPAPDRLVFPPPRPSPRALSWEGGTP